MNQEKFGNFLSTLRNERHMTQEQLAEKLHVSSKTISKWECGNTIPDFETLINISKEFNISLYELSEGEKIAKKNPSNNDILKTPDKNHSKKNKLKKKIIFIITCIIIIVSLISIIYTITNFNNTRVYTIESINENFKVYGSYTQTKHYSVFSITKIEYIGEYYDLEETKIKDYSYKLFNEDTKIYSYVQNNLQNTSIIADELFSKINILIDSNNYNIHFLNKSQNLTITIRYFDENNKNENGKIDIDLKLVKNFGNNKIW